MSAKGLLPIDPLQAVSSVAKGGVSAVSSVAKGGLNAVSSVAKGGSSGAQATVDAVTSLVSRLGSGLVKVAPNRSKAGRKKADSSSPQDPAEVSAADAKAATALFQRFDLDENEKLTYHEASTAIKDLARKETPGLDEKLTNAQVFRIFDAADADENATLDLHEFTGLYVRFRLWAKEEGQQLLHEGTRSRSRGAEQLTAQEETVVTAIGNEMSDLNPLAKTSRAKKVRLLRAARGSECG
jgi:hypothetical protein